MKISYQIGQIPHHHLDLRCGKTLRAGEALSVSDSDLESIGKQFARSFVRSVVLPDGNVRLELLDEPREHAPYDRSVLSLFKVEKDEPAPAPVEPIALELAPPITESTAPVAPEDSTPPVGVEAAPDATKE